MRLLRNNLNRRLPHFPLQHDFFNPDDLLLLSDRQRHTVLFLVEGGDDFAEIVLVVGAEVRFFYFLVFAGDVLY